MGFLSDKLEARKSEKFVKEMRQRASIVADAFKNIYAETNERDGHETEDSKVLAVAKANIEKFLIRVFEEETKQGKTVPVLEVSEETIRQFVWYSDFSHTFEKGINAGHLVAWAQNMNENVRAGKLVMMPGATVESSRGYRGLLHANAICQKMEWNWGSTEKSKRDYADHSLALLVGDLMAFIFDKYGLGSEAGFAGQFGSSLLNLWNISDERAKLES
jgi:hypothetical protein